MDGDYVMMPGNRNGHLVLVDLNSWMYYHRNGYRRFRCFSYLTCGCGVTIVEQEDGTFVSTGTPHLHNNHMAAIHQMMIFQAIKVRLLNEPLNIKEIYDEEVERMNITDVPYSKIRSSLQRIRRTRQPPNPLSVEEAGELIVEFPCYRHTLSGNTLFFRGMVIAGNESALVFISPGILPSLRTTREIGIDATFQITPYLFYQLMTFHVIAFDHCFPVGYALMTAKTAALYEQVIERIKLVAFQTNRVALEPQLMISDYEIAILSAVSSQFPGGRARGCYFHQSQAMYRYAMKLGLKNSYNEQNGIVKKIVRMMTGIALLHPLQAAEGFDVVKAQGRLEMELHGFDIEIVEAVENVFDYTQRFWFNRIGPIRFCVQGDPRRTNNHLESFYRKLNKKMNGSHLNLWVFIKHLQKMDASETLDYNNARNGILIRRPRSLIDRRRQSRILQSTAKLNRMEYTIAEFLEIVAAEFEPVPVGIQQNEEPEVNLQLDLDDIFIRVLGQEIPAPQPVLNLPANPAPIPQPQQVERRVPRNDDAVNQNLAPGRAERSRRRQELILNQRRIAMINPVDDVEMLDNLMPNPLPVPQNPPMPIVQEEIGVNPPAPEARNIHLCSVCTTNVIDHFFNCGHPFCSQCLTTLRNNNAPNPSLCPRCREPFVESVRIYF